MNRENLLKLADYLEGPKLRARFDMAVYGGSECATECGSVGCAVGHGPYAGIPKASSEDWGEYAERVFGITVYAWHFLFGVGWSKHKNDPRITAARIRHFVNNGVPSNWGGDYTWEPPVEQPTKQEPKVIYKTVVIDKEVVKLQTELHDN